MRLRPRPSEIPFPVPATQSRSQNQRPSLIKTTPARCSRRQFQSPVPSLILIFQWCDSKLAFPGLALLPLLPVGLHLAQPFFGACHSTTPTLQKRWDHIQSAPSRTNVSASAPRPFRPLCQPPRCCDSPSGNPEVLPSASQPHPPCGCGPALDGPPRAPADPPQRGTWVERRLNAIDGPMEEGINRGGCRRRPRSVAYVLQTICTLLPQAATLRRG
jgi:hypothetical protein